MIKFDFDTKKFEGISLEQVEFWVKCFPDIDVTDQIVCKAASWLDADKKRAKKDYKKFLRNWLSKAQRDAAFLNKIRRSGYDHGDESRDRGNL